MGSVYTDGDGGYTFNCCDPEHFGTWYGFTCKECGWTPEETEDRSERDRLKDDHANRSHGGRKPKTPGAVRA